MPRVSKERRRADQFRCRAAEMLKDPDWLDEGVRYWLQKQLRRQDGYVYSENEHAALARIVAASTLFQGWDGCSVGELLNAAYRYKADGNDDDERVLDEFVARNVTQLRLGEMGHLVNFCRNVAGVPLARFEPEAARYEAVE